MTEAEVAEQNRRLALMREMAASGEAAEIRAANGLGLRSMAKLLGVATTTYVGWEQGKGFSNNLALRWWEVLERLEH